MKPGMTPQNQAGTEMVQTYAMSSFGRNYFGPEKESSIWT